MEIDRDKTVYSTYLNALSIIIKGIQSLYDFIEKEYSNEKYLENFVK